MATTEVPAGSTDILGDVLKNALAPMAGFQRDFQALTQGFGEFRNDLRLATAETTRTWRDGLKQFTESLDKLSDVLARAGVGAARKALTFDELMTDLQVENKLTDGQRENLASRIRTLAQKTDRKDTEIAEIIKPLFDKLGEGFENSAAGVSDLERAAENVARAATAYSYDPKLFSEILAPVLRREGISSLIAREIPLLLGKTAQDARIEPGQLKSGLSTFHNKILGTGLKGKNAVLEFGSLATVAKDFEEDWGRRSALMMTFIEKLKSGNLADGTRLMEIMKRAVENRDSPIQAALQALASEKDGGAGSLKRLFGTDTPDRSFAGFMLEHRGELSSSRSTLKERAGRDVETALASRRNSADGSVQGLSNAGDRLSVSLMEGLLPAVTQASQALTDWANKLSGAARENPGPTAYLVGAGIAGAVGVKALGALLPILNPFKRGGAEGKAGAALAGSLPSPLPVYVVNLPGAGFGGRGLTPLLDGPRGGRRQRGPRGGPQGGPRGGRRRRGAVPDAGGIGPLVADPAYRIPQPQGGGLFGGSGGLARRLLGRVFRPLGMIDDAATAVSAAGRGDMAGVGRGVGSGLGGIGGAMLGASLGSVVPIAGTLVGGLIGGAIGSFGGGSLLERVLGGGAAAGPPVPPLQPGGGIGGAKPESFADQLHKLGIELTITGLPDGAAAHARCRWDDFAEAAYCGLNIHSGFGPLRRGGPR